MRGRRWLKKSPLRTIIGRTKERVQGKVADRSFISISLSVILAIFEIPGSLRGSLNRSQLVFFQPSPLLPPSFLSFQRLQIPLSFMGRPACRPVRSLLSRKGLLPWNPSEFPPLRRFPPPAVRLPPRPPVPGWPSLPARLPFVVFAPTSRSLPMPLPGRRSLRRRRRA